MKIHFKDIDEKNIEKVKKLKLKSGQEGFIETVEDCLEEAREYKEWHPVAIYNEDEVVGFAMYGHFDHGNWRTWIDRLLIDENHQGKGIGKTSMKKLVEVVSKEYKVDIIYLSIIGGNKVAYNLYTSVGFEDMNEIDPSNGESMFIYTIK